VRGIGGELTVESAPGAGTKLQIRLDPKKAAK
jgi:signal transduction histidine kinase